ncbi:MAG: hypothetical protein QOJ17_6078 [Rhodospirillaceae bacterium]|nr:hypothetical protein [Rhodospirillaceae bacterium]
MRAVRQTAAYRVVVLLVWGLAAYATVTCRGLFWDGSSFLVNILDHGRFHDFYVARAHVDWVTQVPVLLLSELGVRDTRLLAMAYSAALFGLPTALYHLALARVRHDAVLLAIVIAAVVVVYLPTSFFIIGEYNATFAAVTAGMAVTLTARENRLGDAALLCVLGVFCVRSYEAMVYLGPLLAAAIVWSRRNDTDGATRVLAGIAALAFGAGAVVAAATIADYWTHPHFLKVRSMSFDFWQNLQFAIPLAGLALSTLVGLARPAWLQGRGPLVVMAIAATALSSTPWWRLLHEHSILYPPAHYLARQAAGLLLVSLLACMWLHVAWQRKPPLVLATLRLPAVSQRLVAAMTVLVIAAAIPDVALTGLWSDYLGRLRNQVDSRRGIIRASALPLLDWPDKLFAQDWSLPAMSAIVSRTPGRAFVRVDNDFLSNPPFDPACGTLPRLKGYGWR